MNGISQDLFINVNTVLSKSTFLFKLLALVPLVKLDHFMVKDAFFFDNQQTGRNHLCECIRLDTPFYCFKSAYCGEWLFNLDTLHEQTFFENIPIQSPFCFSSAARRWSVTSPQGFFTSLTSFQRKERRESLGTRLSIFSCFVQSLHTSKWREWKHLQTSFWKSVSLEEIFRGLRSPKKIPSSQKLEPWKDLFWSVIVELTLGVF